MIHQFAKKEKQLTMQVAQNESKKMWAFFGLNVFIYKQID